MDDLFFALSKLIGKAARPESWLFMLLLVALLALLRNRRRIAIWSLAASLVFFLAIAIFPVGDLLLAPLERQFPVRPPVQAPAYIVVLGGAEDIQQTVAAGIPNTNAAGDRLFAAIELARAHPQAKVILSGNGSSREPEEVPVAEIAARILVASGIGRDRLIIEATSRNTAENAGRSAEMPGVDPLSPIILVTSASHMPRSFGAFCAAGWKSITPYPVDQHSGNSWRRIGWGFADNLADLNIGAHEWMGLVAYYLTGRIEDLLPRRCRGNK